ncbi:MAG: SRPBCC family protein, partial [Actinomycetota bacterium]
YKGVREMTQLHVEAEAVSQAAPAAVWALVANADSYRQWGPWADSGYERVGEDGPLGAGAIRWFQYGGRTRTVEKVLIAESGQRLVYTVVAGLPVRNYRAEVTLSPAGSGTKIAWSARWDRTLGGRIVHRKLRVLYPEIVAALTAAADREVLPATS